MGSRRVARMAGPNPATRKVWSYDSKEQITFKQKQEKRIKNKQLFKAANRG